MDTIYGMMQGTNLALVDVEQLYPGDVLLTTSSSWTSTAIRAVTASVYSHAALYTGGGILIQSTPGDGIAFAALELTKAETLPSENVSRILGTLPPARVLHVYRHELLAAQNLSIEQRRKLQQTVDAVVLEHWGMDYPLLEALGDATTLLSEMPRLKHWVMRQAGQVGPDKDKVVPGAFCSELVNNVLADLGLAPLRRSIPRSVSPQDLANQSLSRLLRQPQVEAIPDVRVPCDEGRLAARQLSVRSAVSLGMTRYRNEQLRGSVASQDLDTALSKYVGAVQALLARHKPPK